MTAPDEVNTVKIAFQPTSFELQLVSVQVSHITVLVANVYRPPRCSKTTFLDEFAEMLTLIERGFSEKLIICGDFSLPGLNSISIDDRLSTLLDTHGYQQHVSEPTRCNNLLDLLITPISSEMQTLVSNVTVVSSNDLSDHNLVIGDLSIRRIKQAATQHSLHYDSLHYFACYACE